MSVARLFAAVGFSLLVAGSASSQGAGSAEKTIITFGAGPIDGAYYDVVSAVCASFNAREAPGLRCSPDPTPGSLYNLFALERGDLDFALVQSDWHRAAYEGIAPFPGEGGIGELRSVLSLYPEPFTILARRESGIRSILDLPGHRVDHGPANSGRRATVNRVFAALEFDPSDFTELADHVTSVALDELCAGNIDAVLLVIGHPNRAVAETLSDCDVVIADARPPGLGDFLSGNPDYAVGIVPADAYPELRADVRTFSVTATVVTLGSVPHDLVARLSSTVLEEIDAIARAAPVIGRPTVEQMTDQGLTARPHPAATAAVEAQDASN